MKRFFVTFAVVANLLLADTVVKELAAGLLKGSAAVSVIPGIFDLAYVENRGCAWGMFQGAVWPLATFGALALLFLIWKRRAVFGDSWAAPCLMYAGIMGNLVDRLGRGYVIDMFDFHCGVHHFPCFNLADTYICIAAGLLILDSIRQDLKKKVS
ncbi:MAG: signal peptidase II [Kiritimatiellae bacterium]|nr:signal peptidase II [Kiritimatiellia bacterium]